MKYINRLFIAVIFSLVITVTGCTTVKVEKGPTIRMTQQGRIYVGDKYTGLKKMIKQLKSDGIKTSDYITIQIPNNTSKNALTAIGRELASNGYSHILFKHEVKPVSKVGPDPLIKHLYEK
jgi:biopolymer transport protein ExbD